MIVMRVGVGVEVGVDKGLVPMRVLVSFPKQQLNGSQENNNGDALNKSERFTQCKGDQQPEEGTAGKDQL